MEEEILIEYRIYVRGPKFWIKWQHFKDLGEAKEAYDAIVTLSPWEQVRLIQYTPTLLASHTPGQEKE